MANHLKYFFFLNLHDLDSTEDDEEAQCVMAVSGDDISHWEEEPQFKAMGRYGVVY
jgi:hypothetical protein